ncbi:MAG TPA: hypothetical protein VJN95_00460 [Gemmatimonadales bacterium]|nr:hypothetical protein [Gemmatimonadales bacterium]
MPLLDIWMPEYDTTATYGTTVAAPAEQVYQAILATDFGRHPLVAFLMGIRLLPGLLTRPRETLHRLREREERATRSLGSMVGANFVLLQADPPRELVLGITGRFWTLAASLSATDPATFRELPPAGTARAAWNFSVTPLAQGGCRLATETRVRCADDATRRQFRRYWTLVAPGSGLIRIAILGRIRKSALSLKP